jgi:hypothetical protein
VKNRFQSLPFKFNLQRYSEATDELTASLLASAVGVEPQHQHMVGLCTSPIQQLTHSLKPPGFNP